METRHFAADTASELGHVLSETHQPLVWCQVQGFFDASVVGADGWWWAFENTGDEIFLQTSGTPRAIERSPYFQMFEPTWGGSVALPYWAGCSLEDAATRGFRLATDETLARGPRFPLLLPELGLAPGRRHRLDATVTDWLDVAQRMAYEELHSPKLKPVLSCPVASDEPSATRSVTLATWDSSTSLDVRTFDSSTVRVPDVINAMCERDHSSLAFGDLRAFCAMPRFWVVAER